MHSRKASREEAAAAATVAHLHTALLLATAATFATALLQAAPVDAAGIGAAFGGARDPVVCSDRHAPASGPISVAQAKRYVQCEYEMYWQQDDALWLMDVKSIEMGQPRPFNLRADSGGDYDVSQPIYPLRGSIVKYTCHKPGYAYVAGQQCYIWDVADAKGQCGRTNFHDWKCTLNGSGPMRKGPPPK